MFDGGQAVERGLLTKAELRTSAWRQLFRGVYMDASTPLTYELRCHAAALFVAPPGAVIAGRSAAHLLGATRLDVDEPVELLLPPGPKTRVRGVAAHFGRLAPEDQRANGDLVLTSPARTCWDIAQWYDLIEAVVLVDAMLSGMLVSKAELERYAAERAGARGCRRLMRVAALAFPGAASGWETRLRVKFALAWLPQPEVRYTVQRQDQGVARVALAWPTQRVAVDCEPNRDARRLNALTAAGWLVFHAAEPQRRSDFNLLANQVHAALRART